MDSGTRFNQIAASLPDQRQLRLLQGRVLLYYIACSERLAWGYVDQPPLAIVFLWLARQIMGDSVFAVRLLAVAAEAGVVVLAGLTVRVMGGGTFAQGLAALVTLMTPVFLAVSTFYSMNALEHFFWSLAVYVLVLLIRNNDPASTYKNVARAQ